MKEIIEAINLPKQILDKTEKFVSTIFGPSAKEFGELFADKVRYRRLKNQVDIFSKTIKMLEGSGLEAKELNLRTLIPLIEKSSIEDDPNLQDRWAKLIANICSSPETGLEPRLINTLSNLSSTEANILDFIQIEFIKKRKNRFEYLENNSLFGNKYSCAEEIPIDEFSIDYKGVGDKFNLSSEFLRIYIDNLERLGLIQFQDPEIEIDSGSSDAEFDEDDRSVNLELQVTAEFQKYDDFHLTTFGNYFMKQCKI